GPVWLLQSAEAHIAGRIGLCHAVGEFIEAGPERVWRRLAEVGSRTREALADLPGWSVVTSAGPAGTGSATTALRATAGQDIAAARARLRAEHGIGTSACGVPRP